MPLTAPNCDPDGRVAIVAGSSDSLVWAKALELGAAAVVLASSAASCCTGSVVTVDGGNTAAL